MLISTRKQFEFIRTVLSMADRVTVDTETTGLEPHTGDRLCGIATRCLLKNQQKFEQGILEDQLIDGNPVALEAYFPFRHRPGTTLFDQSDNLPADWLPEILRVLNKPSGVLRFHHAKFDLHMFAYEGFDYHNNPFQCTQIMSWLNNESESHRLKDLHNKYITKSQSKEREAVIKDYVHREGSYDLVAPAAMEPYACGDVRDTDDIYDYLYPRLVEQELLPQLDLEYRFSRLLFEMERYGIGIDYALCGQYAAQVVHRMEELLQELRFDPMKGIELARRLFAMPPEGLGLRVPEKLTQTVTPEFPSGVPEIRKEWLSQHVHLPLVANVLEYRSLVKANGTWFRGFKDHADRTVDGRIHTTFNGTGRGKSKMGLEGKSGTVTGRLNSSNPNVHQIPRQDEAVESSLAKQVKKIFLPGRQRYGLFEMDYSQIEVRIAAGYAEATLMLEALRSGADPHAVTADRIGCSRQTAKHATYTTLYGGGPETLAHTIERLEFLTTGAVIIYPVDEAREIIAAYFELYPGFKRMQQQCAMLMKTRGYIKLWDGRKRHFEKWYDPRSERVLDNSHKAFNSLIQGGAASVIKHTMLMIPWHEKQHAYRLVNQVHDSLWVEVVDDFREDWLEELQWYMSWPGREPAFKCPFTVDVKMLSHQPFDVSEWMAS